MNLGGKDVGFLGRKCVSIFFWVYTYVHIFLHSLHIGYKNVLFDLFTVDNLSNNISR